jgi:hypothetical protein
MEQKDLQNRFTYHASDATKMAKFESIRKNMFALSMLINEYCPEGREKSLAITNLEQAQFWANAAIAREEK